LIRFDSSRELFDFRIANLIAPTDFDWARGISNDYGFSWSRDDLLSKVRAVFGAYSSDPDADKSELQAAIEEHRLLKLPELAAKDTSLAVKVANQIEDPFLRILAFTTIIPNLRGIDESQAKSRMAEAHSALDAERSSLRKLRLLVPVVAAEVALGDEGKAAEHIIDALDASEKLVRDDLFANPFKASYMAYGYDEGLELAQIAGERCVAAGSALARIREVEVAPFRSHLLAFYVRGLNQHEENCVESR
jgi:hypothetical protein